MNADLFNYVLPEKAFADVKDRMLKNKAGTIRQIQFLLDGQDYVFAYEKLQDMKRSGETNSDCLLRILRTL